MAVFALRSKSGAQNRPPVSQRTRQEARWFYLFISPWLLGFILLSLIPLVVSLAAAFSNFNGVNFNTLRFVGFANFERAFADGAALASLWRTFALALVIVPITQFFAFLLAVALNQPLYGRTLFRLIFYLPSILPVVALTWIFRMLFGAENGLINGVISVTDPNVIMRWLVDFPAFVLIFLLVWSATGSNTLVYLAGLQSVSTELEDAARIDGAGRWNVLQHITMPLMSPIIFYQLIQGLIGSLQLVVQPLLLSESTRNTGALTALPPQPIYTAMVHIFQVTFGRQLFGYGSALNWLLFVVILVLTIVVFRFSEYWVYYESDSKDKEKA
jgi:multiple sugar transport system permease protein